MNDNKRNAIVWIWLLLLGTAYLVFMHTLFRIQAIDVVKYLVLTVVSILIPGLAILSLMELRMTRICTICFAYILGYAFIVFEYFFCEIFDRAISFKTISLVTTVLSAAVFIFIGIAGKKTIRFKESDSMFMDLIILTLLVFFNVFGYAAYYVGTDVSPVFVAHRDIQYWVNNTIALKLSWPADNLFFWGNTLNYHYFSNIPIAFLSDVYNLDVFSMSFPFYSLSKAIIVFGGTDLMLSIVTDDKRARLLGFILLLFNTGAENIAVVTIVNHVLLAPFGFDIGYAYAMAFLGLMFIQWGADEWNPRLFAGAILLWSMCVGAKAPIASVVIILAAMICLHWLINRKPGLAFGYGLSILFMFFVICKYCVGMFSVASGDAAWELKLYKSNHFTYMLDAEAWDIVGSVLVSIGKRNRFAGLAIRTLCFDPAVVTGMLISAVLVIVWIKRGDIDSRKRYMLVALAITSMIGLLLWHLVDAGGSSEMYFAMTAIITMSVFIVVSFDMLIKEQPEFRIKNAPLAGKIVGGFLAVLIIIGGARYLWHGWESSGALRNSVIGIQNLYDPSINLSYKDNPDIAIRRSDVEALDWIRCNSAPDALIMTDNAVITGNDRYHMYGMFCERQQYVEGTDMLLSLLESDYGEVVSERIELVKGVYDNSDEALNHARDIGIDYIVQTKDITPNFAPGSELRLVKSTETMNIYQFAS